MAERFNFGELAERLMCDAEASFPMLAPISISLDRERAAWRVTTMQGAFEMREEVASSRRQLVEFFAYQLGELQRGAEREARRRGTHLRVGDRITVNGRESRIVHIADGVVTLEHLDPREIRQRCDCQECRERQHRDRVDAYDAMRYAMPMRRITPAAEARAMELLRRNLTPEQLEMWDRERAIEVRGQSGARYRIRGVIAAYNVDRIGHGRLCCTPGAPHSLPLGDYVLGQKLALELDEDAFLREANFAEQAGPITVTTAAWEGLLRDAYQAPVNF